MKRVVSAIVAVGTAVVIGACLLVMPGARAEAKDGKIGYIDVPRILEEYEGFQDARKELDKDRAKREEEFAGRFKDLQKYSNDLKEKWSLLSEAKRKEKEEDLMKRQKELQDWRTVQMTELTEKEEGLIKRLEADVRKVLDTIGPQKKLSFVVRKDLFLYVERDSVDVTNDVLAALRRQNAGK